MFVKSCPICDERRASIVSGHEKLRMYKLTVYKKFEADRSQSNRIFFFFHYYYFFFLIHLSYKTVFHSILLQNMKSYREKIKIQTKTT